MAEFETVLGEDPKPEDFGPDDYPQSYLGDGVYASFDGYQIWLAANDHRNKVIALEPMVMNALLRYARTVFERGSAEGSESR